MADPPFRSGAVKVREAELGPVDVAIPIVGALGTTEVVVTELEAAEGREVPAELLAVTIKV